MGKLLRVLLIAAVAIAIVIGLGLVLFSQAYSATSEIVYREIDGIPLRLDVFEPSAGETKKPRPTILFFHGGAWTTGSPQQFHPYATHFAELGWMAFSAQYRINADHGTNAFDALDDARAAYQYLLDNAEKLNVDTSRIVLSGGSAGGHLSAAIAMIPPPGGNLQPQPAALALLNPALNTVFDPEEMIAKVFDGRGEEISPAHHVGPNQPPTLIIHGTEDGLVPYSDMQKFCKDMTQAGNRCEIRAYEGEGHGFWNWGFGLYDEVLEEVVRFSREIE